MKIIIQTPDFVATKKLTSFVEEKVSKLSSISDRVHEARVSMKIDKSDSKENKVCEIRLGIAGNDLFASRQSESFEKSVTTVVEALKHQLARIKSEKKNSVRDSSSL
jgi:putative sigma-54 modulation protein